MNSELNRFGVPNGGGQDASLLNEKWESIDIVPVDGLIGDDEEWFAFSMSDTDFISQDWCLEGGALWYADESGYAQDSAA